MHTYACEADEGAASYPPLPIDGGFLVFGPVAVLEDEGKPNPEMGVGLNFIDCSAGTKKFIARLPYVAGAGEVQDAFFADIEPDSKGVVIIHSAPIRAFTGVSYGNDYFSVMVFRLEGNALEFDKRLTDYFGSGADVVSYRDEGDIPIYTYPYKTRSAIIERLKSEKYRKWVGDAQPGLTVLRKAVIYSSMNVATPTKMYLIKDDKVKQESISAGCISILYETAKGKKIRGWILCGDVGEC
ncbi:hypothetical protein PsexTeo8_37890 [Pseudomonas extremaustralis]|nr:hypothetical protein [Pseudomonas extremaustralis]